MYFRRTRKLDLPINLQKEILSEINGNLLRPTGMDELANMPPLQQLLDNIVNLPPERQPTSEEIEYKKALYGATNLKGWELSEKLTADIYKHYDSFLKMVPDDPKIFIKYIISSTGKFHLHCGKAQLSSLTCLIRGEGPETVWYEPKPEFYKKYRAPAGSKHRNTKGINAYPPDAERITSIKLKPWEMIFFDHNSLHEVEGIFDGFDRILFSIGFLNITETELEDIYDEWHTKNKKDQ